MKIDKKILFKGIFPALTTLLIFIIFSYFIALPHLEQSLQQDKIAKLKDLTQSVYDLLEYNYLQAKQNHLNLDSVKKVTLEIVRNIRYGKNHKEYYWINDTNHVMLMHPFRPDLENKNLKYIKDPKGVYLIQDFVKIAKSKGEGISKYMWQYKEDSSLIQDKISYVKLFKPWGWIIGTGVYYNDIKESMKEFQRKFIYYSLIVAIIILIITFYIIYHNSKIELEKNKYLEELKSSEQKFRTIAEQALIGISIIQNDKIIYFNEACEKMFGYKEDEVKSFAPGEFFNVLVDEEYHNLIKNQVFKKQIGIKDQVLENYEWLAIRKNGEKFWVHTFSRTIEFNKAPAVLSLLIDINKRKKLEADLKKLTDDLEYQVKLRTKELNEALEDIKTKNEQLEDLKDSLTKSLEKEKELNNLKNQFISMISHEYRTPLTILSSSLEIIENHLQRNYQDSLAKLNKQFQKSQFAIQKMVYLLEQVLNISKDFQNELPVNYEEINLPDFINDIVENIMASSKNRKIIFNTFSNKVNYKTDKILFEQILENLISNAIKYSPNDKEIIINLNNNGNNLKLEIQDFGIGLEENELRNIYTPFFRSETNIGIIEGLGLGMSIVKRNADLLGIKIDIDSKKGEGTLITLTLN